MNIKKYLLSKRIRISDIAEKSGLPYSTVSVMINGKEDIDQCRIGAARAMAEACDLSFDDFYKLCKEMTRLPEIKDGKIFIRNQHYCLNYAVDGEEGTVTIGKVNDLNRQFIKAAAEMEIGMIRRRKEIEDVKAWKD